jgi:hypothetical protein
MARGDTRQTGVVARTGIRHWERISDLGVAKRKPEQ